MKVINVKLSNQRFINKKLMNLRSLICGILVSISFAIFAFQQIIIDYYSNAINAITILVAFITGLYIWCKTIDQVCIFIKDHITLEINLILFSIFISVAGYMTKGVNYNTTISFGGLFHFLRLRYYLIACLCIFYGLNLLVKCAKELLEDLFSNISIKEKKMYIVFSGVISILIVLLYVINPMWFQQIDNVYSIDSGWCFNNIYPDINYYDIRHPLLSEIAFTLWAIIRVGLKIIAPANLIIPLSAAFIQIINIQLSILVGIMLWKISGSKWAAYMYLCSFPTILFFVALEKFQICVFLLVLYTYIKCRKLKYSTGVAVMTIGVMPTNAFIVLLELFDDNSPKEKIKNIAKLVACGVLTIICFGRGFLLNIKTLFEQISQMHSAFGSGSLSIYNRINSVLNMIGSSFITLSSSATESYLWVSVYSRITIMAIFVMILMLVGAIVKRKDRFYKICIAWVAFAFVLFVGLNWAPHESPLFAIIFSWAIIPLAVSGMQWLFHLLKLNEEIVYKGCMLLMTIINVATIVDINKYLLMLN